MKRRFSLSLVVLLLLSILFTGCDMVSVVGANPNYRIAGTVKDKNGQPLQSVKITVTPGGEVLTNEDGEWEFTKAKKGSLVTAELKGWVFSPEAAGVSENGQKINFTGVKPYTVTVRVQDQAGNLIPGAQISFTDAATSKLLDTVIAEDGTLVKDDLVDPVVVGVSRDDYEFSTDSFTVEGDDTSLVFTGTIVSFTVSGTVRSSNNVPLAGVAVGITRNGESWQRHVFTDPDGRFTVSGLKGKVRVTPKLENWSFSPVIVEVDGDSDLYFTARETSYSVDGRVEDPAGQGLTNVAIRVETTEGSHKTTVWVDAEGSFSIHGLSGRFGSRPSGMGGSLRPIVRLWTESAARCDSSEERKPFPSAGRLWTRTTILLAKSRSTSRMRAAGPSPC